MFRIIKNIVIGLLFILLILTVVIGINFVFKNHLCLKDIGIVFSILFSSIGILFGSLTYFFNRESNEKTQIEKYYTSLTNEINETLFDDKKGVDAYLSFKLESTVKNVFLDNLNLVLLSYEMYLKLIDENKIVSKTYKTFSKNKLHLLFYSKVLWSLHDTIIKDGQEFIKDKHDDSKITIPKFADLSITCINYLIDKQTRLPG
jgi:hypothetical protein